MPGTVSVAVQVVATCHGPREVTSYVLDTVPWLCRTRELRRLGDQTIETRRWVVTHRRSGYCIEPAGFGTVQDMTRRLEALGGCGINWDLPLRRINTPSARRAVLAAMRARIDHGRAA